MKRIIVEGMDSTGKSTLIAALCDQFHNLELIVNFLGPEQDFDTWWPRQLSEDLSPYVAIHDRFFYSELVYGQVLRGYVKASGPVVKAICQSLRRDALIIYCRPSTDAILATIENKPQMEGVVDKQARLLKGYDVLMTAEAREYPGGRFRWYDYETDDVRLLIARTERYLFGEDT